MQLSGPQGSWYCLFRNPGGRVGTLAIYCAGLYAQNRISG